jgi:hypothetical protein
MDGGPRSKGVVPGASSSKIFSKNFAKGVTNRPAQTLYKQKEKKRFLLTKNEYYDIL